MYSVLEMWERAMEVFSICVRITALTLSYLIPYVFFMNQVLPRRRSQALLLVVISVGLLAKNVVIAYLIPDSGLDELTVMEIRFLFAICFSAAVYVLLCYTYRGSVLKLGLAQIAGETNYYIFISVLLPFINWAEGRSDLGSYGVPFLPLDLLMIPAVYGLFRLEFFFLKPWLPRIREYEPRHRSILWVVVTAYLLAGIHSNFMSLVELGLFRTTARIPAILSAVPGCAGCIWLYAVYRRRTERTNKFTRVQKELMRLHYSSVKRQIRKMEQEQEKIDMQMREITAMIRQEKEKVCPDGGEREKIIQSYLQALREKYDEIQAGIWCKDYLADSVLCHMADVCRERQIKVAFSFQKYDRGIIPEEEIAEILFQILDYCVRESTLYREKTENQHNSPPSVFLCAAAVKNMLLLEFSCQSIKSSGRMRRELRKGLFPLLLPYHGEIEIEDGNEKRFCVRIQRG